MALWTASARPPKDCNWCKHIETGQFFQQFPHNSFWAGPNGSTFQKVENMVWRLRHRNRVTCLHDLQHLTSQRHDQCGLPGSFLWTVSNPSWWPGHAPVAAQSRGQHGLHQALENHPSWANNSWDKVISSAFHPQQGRRCWDLIADFHVCTTKPSEKFKKGCFTPVNQFNN